MGFLQPHERHRHRPGQARLTKTGKTVVVHSLEHARAALAAADGLGVPVTLISAEGAAGTLGPLVFKSIVEQARAAHPGVEAEAILDCADRPGHAAAALRAGFAKLRFAGRSKAAAALCGMAADSGAEILARRPRALDLAGEADPEAACRAWLARR